MGYAGTEKQPSQVLVKYVSAKPRMKFKLKVSLCCDFMFISVGFSISLSSQYCAYVLGLYRKNNRLWSRKHNGLA